MKLAIRRERLNWHGGAERLRLMHLSDFHVQGSGRQLSRVEEVIRREAPDWVLMTGDYSDTVRGARVFAAFVERMAGEVPVYWIRGNHDEWHGGRQIRELERVAQARCVDREPEWVTSERGFRYQILSWETHAAADPGAPGEEHRIVLVHNPKVIRSGLLGEKDLVLAGHLHGGQIVLGRRNGERLFPGCLIYRWCGERHAVRGATVIVSKGLGDTLPLRFRCPHEVVMIEIE